MTSPVLLTTSVDRDVNAARYDATSVAHDVNTARYGVSKMLVMTLPRF